MLIKLKLKNVALIEIIEINFEKGLNIITGDSGSGKSLILDSLNVLFGGTNIPLNHLIRHGKDYCLIEAKFISSDSINAWLITRGITENFSELLIKRKSYKKNNKILTSYTLNNFPVKKRFLEELRFLLVDFAEQSDAFLFDSLEYRRLIIDDLGSQELEKINLEVKNAWHKCENLKYLINQKVELARKQEENSLKKKEMFKILDQANLNSCDEILELESQEKRLANSIEINDSINAVLNNLNNHIQENSSIGVLISQSIKYLNKIADVDEKIQKFREKLLSIQNDVEVISFELSSYIQDVENNDFSLHDIQNRLFFLKNLERTFSLELPYLIHKRDQLKNDLFKKNFDNEIKNLKDELKTLQSHLSNLFLLQSSKRKHIAKKLQNSVMSTLSNLGLENSTFIIQFEEVSPSAEGIDNIKFLFSANPDQKLAPISKIISGGEMSRFLLAIKSSISKKSNTFSLDEIDNGLSGKSLFSLVKLIKLIAQDKQVLCITHQPFLAAAGKVHFKVKKNVVNGLTFTSIIKLKTKKHRQNELIDMFGGVCDKANDYASILLERGAA